MSDTTTPAEPAATPATTPAEPAATPITQSALTTPAPATEPAATPAPTEPKAAEPTEPQPVEYKDFKLPEGANAEDGALTAFQAEAAKLGIPQQQAEALLSQMAPKVAEVQQQAWVAMNEQWQSEVMAMPEFKGSPQDPNSPRSKTDASIGRLFDDFVGAKNTPERQALDQALHFTGAGNNPAIVRAFTRIAAQYTESTSHVSGSPSRTPVDAAAMMYPNSAPAGANKGA